MVLRIPHSAVLVLLLLGCETPQPGPSFPDREPGARTPLSSDCDALDPTRCLLPWPSNTFTVADATSATGLRVRLRSRSLPVLDNPASLNRTDGFSVASPLAVGFPRALDHRLEGSRLPAGVRLFLAQPGRANRGEPVPLRLSVVNDAQADGGTGQSMLLAYPLRPMEYEADYVAVALDSLLADDGSSFETPAPVKVALGLVAPATDEERALAAYHAPTRALLRDAGVDLSHVLRVWDFTTRSAASVSGPLTSMRAAAFDTVDAGAITVEVDSATLFPDGSAVEVRGHVQGLPWFVPDGGISWSAEGLPRAQGVHAAPFRAVLPAGTGTYPMVVYGHGTGGNVNDDTFDHEIVAAGAGKLNLEWAGWTDTSVINTVVSLTQIYTTTARSTAGLLQSLCDAAALEASLSGKLGDAFASPTLAGVTNPAAGRRPDVSKLVYTGGSLGGTMGYVHSLADPTIHYAVLNVPGAAWTHFAPASVLWDTLTAVFAPSTPSAIDRSLGMAMTQANWDPIDGAAWSALSTRTDSIFLLQESMGDPVLPNIGSDFVAASSGAVQVGAVLAPIVGVSPVSGPVTRTALTQFRVPSSQTGELEIHGFAARGSAAGIAAREQISAFLRSVWAGAPKIAVPASCANQSCDFSLP